MNLFVLGHFFFLIKAGIENFTYSYKIRGSENILTKATNKKLIAVSILIALVIIVALYRIISSNRALETIRKYNSSDFYIPSSIIYSNKKIDSNLSRKALGLGKKDLVIDGKITLINIKLS